MAGKVHPASPRPRRNPCRNHAIAQRTIEQPRSAVVAQQARGDPRDRDRAVRREGYEHSKWADVAAAVGIGSTALYHYFESKLHCLYEIMAEALEAEVERFDRITGEREDFAEALEAVLGRRSTSPSARSCATACWSEQVLVGVHRTSAREEEARQLARARTRDLEFKWAAFLTRGMEQGAIPEAEPRLLARDPGALQQRLPLVPPACRARAAGGGRLLVPRCLAAGLPCRCRRRRAPASARAHEHPARARQDALTLRPRPARGSAASRAGRSPCGGPRPARRRSGGCATA